MNTFALEPVEDFTFYKVKYYSVRGENNEYSEFIDFLERIQKPYRPRPALRLRMDWRYLPFGYTA